MRIFLNTLVVLSAVLLTGCMGADTAYAPGFSEAKFARVKVGMTKKEVEKILGEPLTNERYEGRLYKVKLISGDVVPVVVAYSEKGTVQGGNSDVLAKRMIYPGASRSDTEACLHTTESTFAGFRTVYSYSRTRSLLSDSLEVRKIVFDNDENVLTIEHCHEEYD